MVTEPSRIFDFITDEEFRASLESDYAEMARCRDARSWKAVHVLAGSIIEAILIDYLVVQQLVDRKAALALDLANAISLARKHKIISARSSDLSTVVRDYRNLIHPGRAIRLGDTVTSDTARVAESVVVIIVDEVSKKRLENYGYTAEQIAAKLERDSSASAIIRHLLRETKECEIERLLFSILPERYLALLDDEFAPGHAFGSFAGCFRAAVDGASDAVKAKAAKWFVSLLKEESDRAVFSYGTAFLRASDLEHLTPNERTLVKEHLLSRLKNDTSPPLLTAIAGIGKFLVEADVNAFVDPLVKLACSGDRLAARGREVLENEYSRTRGELDSVILKRLTAWENAYTSRKQPSKVAIVEEMRTAYEVGDIPF